MMKKILLWNLYTRGGQPFEQVGQILGTKVLAGQKIRFGNFGRPITNCFMGKNPIRPNFI
jgi:hypothetical protein